MAMHLVVTDPFADYAKGDRISDPAKIKDALDRHATRVVRISVEDEQQPTKASPPQNKP